MNVEEFVQDSISRSLSKYLELHPDVSIPTYVGSGWGVAKTGSGTVPAASGSSVYNSTSVNIGDLGFTGANDYQVVICPALDQPSQNASVDVSVIGKSATTFTVKALATNANMTLSFAVPFLYTVFAKGYGGVPAGGEAGQVMMKRSNADGDVDWKTLTGSGWGVAKIGTTSVTIAGNSGTIVAISFGDLGFTSTDEYTVICESSVVFGTTSVMSKSLTSFELGVRNNGTTERTVGVTYIIIAQGYGATNEQTIAALTARIEALEAANNP